MAINRLVAIIAIFFAFGCAAPSAPPAEPSTLWPARTQYRTAEILGRRIFYREAGEATNPTLVLLHGYPSSSHTYRHLIPLLSGRFRVIAPDNIGSGYSDKPSPTQTTMTFELIAQHTLALLDYLKVARCVLYLQDFGGPVGFRVAIARPSIVQGLIVQNANAYLDGLTPKRRQFFRKAHDDRSAGNIAQLAHWVSDQAIRDTQYLRDVPGTRARFMSPDSWTHDIAMLRSPDDRQLQVQLFQDYQNNIDLYPRWQDWLRETQPPLLVLWGERDPAFIADGAHAYLRDVKNARLHLLDAGHFAAEERPVEVAKRVTEFMQGR